MCRWISPSEQHKILPVAAAQTGDSSVPTSVENTSNFRFCSSVIINLAHEWKTILQKRTCTMQESPEDGAVITGFLWTADMEGIAGRVNFPESTSVQREPCWAATVFCRRPSPSCLSCPFRMSSTSAGPGLACTAARPLRHHPGQHSRHLLTQDWTLIHLWC